MIITPETGSLPARVVRIELLIGQIVREFGAGKLARAADAAANNAAGIATAAASASVVPTDLPSLDAALGGGGIPRGRITEIYGAEGSGKSTLALHVIGAAQRRGGLAAYVDAECALAPAYAEVLGVDARELYVARPASGEQAVGIVEALLRAACFDIIVVDSIAALVPRHELSEADDGGGGLLHAELMSRAMRKLCVLAHRSPTALVFTNQMRYRKDSPDTYVETTTGGRAVPHYASARLELHPDGIIWDEPKVDRKENESGHTPPPPPRGQRTRRTAIGSRVRVHVVKNKMGAPGAAGGFDILSEAGVVVTGDLVGQCLGHGVIGRAGDWFTYRGAKLAATVDGLRAAVADDDALRDDLRIDLDERCATLATTCDA